MSEQIRRDPLAAFAVPSHALGPEPVPDDRCEEGRMRLAYYDALGIEPEESRDPLATAAWTERQLVALGLGDAGVSQSIWNAAFARCPLPPRLHRRSA